MRYEFILPAVYICSTVLLFPDTNKLKDILQHSGEKKVVIPDVQEKKKKNKRSRFIFRDTYVDKGIDSIDKNARKNKSKQYKYQNKSNFKFKFSPGAGSINMVDGPRNSSATGLVGARNGAGPLPASGPR